MSLHNCYYCEYVYAGREFSPFQTLTLASTIREPPPDWTASKVPSHLTLSYVMDEHALGMPCKRTLEIVPSDSTYQKMRMPKLKFGKTWIIYEWTHVHINSKIVNIIDHRSGKKFLIHST